MIVVDASAILEVLLRAPAVARLSDRLFAADETLLAPHLIDVEVAQVLRRYAIAGKIAPERGSEALSCLADFRLTRYPHYVLLPRIWELRDNLAAYDAAYVALAELLDAPLVTRDRRLANAPGHRARIEIV